MTRFEIITAALPLHVQRIAELIYQHGGESVFRHFMTRPANKFDVTHGAGAVLQGAFCWDSTMEGHRYWSALRGWS